MARINLNLSCMKYHSRSLSSFLSFRPFLFNSSRVIDCGTINYVNYFCKNTVFTSGIVNYSCISFKLSNSLLKLTKNIGEHRVRHLQHIVNQKEPDPFVSVTHMKKVLTLRKIDVIDGFTCLIVKCPFCVNPKKSELFINKVTGFVTCNGCRCSGKWEDIEDFLKKNKSLPAEYLDLKKYNNDAYIQWKELCQTAVPFNSLGFDEKILLSKKLNLDELPDNLFEHLNVHVKKDLSCIYVPLKYASNSDIVGYKIVRLTEGNDTIKEQDENVMMNNGNETTEPCHNCRGVLLHKSKNSKKEQAVLVSNFKDFISLGQILSNYYVICLPHGLTSLPQEVLPILERYKKIVLWFGNDTYCWDAARQFAKKLGENRCYFVRPVKENPPPYIIAAENNSINELKRIIESAEPISHPAVINFSSLRQDVISELQNIDKAQGVMWKRFAGLNNLLKGFRRGELSIFTGPTGSGKTTFLSEYSLDLLMQGVPTLWGSFEVRNQRLARTMLQQYVQLPLDLYPEKLNYWADSFERLPLYFMTFHGQQPLKKVLEAVEHASYVHDIAHVIIDNVQFMLGMLDTETNLDRFYRQDALIASFRNFATVHNCHVTLVIHPRKERDAEQLSINSVFGGAKASQEADNVFIIQQKMLQSLKIKKYLQVAKNRFTGDLGLMPLDFDKETLSFSTKSDKKQKKSDSNSISKDEDITKEISGIEDLHLLQ